jgi:hypothetical protein
LVFATSLSLRPLCRTIRPVGGAGAHDIRADAAGVFPAIQVSASKHIGGALVDYAAATQNAEVIATKCKIVNGFDLAGGKNL